MWLLIYIVNITSFGQCTVYLSCVCLAGRHVSGQIQQFSEWSSALHAGRALPTERLQHPCALPGGFTAVRARKRGQEDRRGRGGEEDPLLSRALCYVWRLHICLCVCFVQLCMSSHLCIWQMLLSKATYNAFIFFNPCIPWESNPWPCCCQRHALMFRLNLKHLKNLKQIIF